MYTKNVRSEGIVHLLLYLEDMLVAYNNMTQLNKLKEVLKIKFEMKDLSLTKIILGMDLLRKKSTRRLLLSQSRYLKGTSIIGIMFRRSEEIARVVEFVDSDFIGNLDRRRLFILAIYSNLVEA